MGGCELWIDTQFCQFNKKWWDSHWPLHRAETVILLVGAHSHVGNEVREHVGCGGCT